MSDHTLNEALGNLALLFDITPTRGRSKLNPVEPGTPEFDQMLATIVFDLVKKRALAHRYLRQYMLHADPELTRRVLEEVRELEAAEGDGEDPDYGALMVVAHDQMIRALREVVEDHRALAETVERWDGGEPSANKI